MSNLRYAPEFKLLINGSSAPSALRACTSSVSYQTGLDGVDRVELTLANENLRWLDHPLLALGNQLSVSMGYAPDSLEQVFVGEIVGQSPTFPSGGGPTLNVVAQDRRHRMQQGTQVRWFAIPTPCFGNFPIPDMTVAGLVTAEQFLIPVFDPVSAAIAVFLSGVEMAVTFDDPDARQKIIRQQAGETNFNFLSRLCRENGWEMIMDHSGPVGGYALRFFSLASRLTPEVTLKYGRSLIDFTPRISIVGQIAAVSCRFWKPELNMEFTVTVSWDWDRSALNLTITPGYGLPSPEPSSESSGKNTSVMLVEEPLNHLSAPRVILSKLLAKLNQRLTGSGSTIGDPRIKAGAVLRLEGLGERFGGFYRVTSATHTIDSGGYRTSFEVRKEIWFGSIPLVEQGAVRLQLQGQTVRGG